MYLLNIEVESSVDTLGEVESLVDTFGCTLSTVQTTRIYCTVYTIYGSDYKNVLYTVQCTLSTVQTTRMYCTLYSVHYLRFRLQGWVNVGILKSGIYRWIEIKILGLK